MSNSNGRTYTKTADDTGAVLTAARPGRRSFIVTNTAGANPAYIVLGSSTADSANGFKLAAGVTSPVIEGYTGIIKFVCASGQTADVRVLETDL